jgi:hypothetical protein
VVISRPVQYNKTFLYNIKNKTKNETYQRPLASAAAAAIAADIAG